jgi:hypothetical protein
MKAKKVYEMIDPYADQDSDIGIDISYKNEINKKYIQWFESIAPDTEYIFKDDRIIVHGTLSCINNIKIPAGIKITTKKSFIFTKLTHLPDNIDIIAEGNIILNNLISVGKNVKLVAKITVDLDKAARFGPNLFIRAGCNVWLSKLTELPDNLDLKVANNLYLIGIHNIPEDFYKMVSGKIFLKSGKTITPLMHK